ncbi:MULTISPECIES: hypothetical protein [unclassified Rathayibacter]|uniref:hypothetical protein n=1 Tax=unclassified Rathayibacter TaxID=2609250 RepID=UPI00188B8AFA|nr:MULTISPECIES: hypothetical protein [unclassified Rathayibacter]MBF4462746.1 hypothetical protein [Rathayibacter sp. VKM Ac-2879]MBF4504160.1 hypothetical protein [Rathayibacter sp. VKM Ac-2878]
MSSAARTRPSHFIGVREDLIAMVPGLFPVPDVIVTVTGVLELAAAAAMASRRLAPWAATGLTLLLIRMFPANVDLALSGADLPRNQTLIPRTIMQTSSELPMTEPDRAS